jgi:hypothetical protein
MAFQKGRKKTGGKVKGSINKEKRELIDRIREKFPDLCPIEKMCEIIQTTTEESTIVSCCKEVAQYIYPKLKSIDHNHGGQADNPIKASLEVTFIPSSVKKE